MDKIIESITLLEDYILIPSSIFASIIVLLCVLQIVGSILKACHKTVPPILKVFTIIKEKIKAKRQKKKAIEAALQALPQFNKLLADVQKRYGEDNISKRDRWMIEVNSTMHWARERAKVYDASVADLKDLAKIVKAQSTALDLNNKMTSDLYKQSARSDVLDFSHKLINARNAEKPLIVSREEFRKIRKTYEAYEEFLQTYGGTNGEVDDAMEVVRRAERGELPNIQFLEDIRN